MWVVAAWAVVLAEFVLAIYLGLKRPGVGPVKAFLYGPPVIAVVALALGVCGVVWSALRRPFATTQRLVAWCLLGFVILSATYPLPFPSARSSRPSAVRVRFPLEGEWTTAWGGEGEMSQMLRTRPDRCFGFAFVLARDGITRAESGDPRTAFALHAPVVAPASGTVVRVVDDLPDEDAPREHDLGNHVVLEVAPQEFLFVCGLEQGSCAVRVGESIAAGAPLARVGASGRSLLLPEAHLALHMQDTPDPLWGQGIPFYFFESSIDGARIARAVPTGRGYFPGRAITGQRIAHTP